MNLNYSKTNRYTAVIFSVILISGCATTFTSEKGNSYHTDNGIRTEKEKKKKAKDEEIERKHVISIGRDGGLASPGVESDKDYNESYLDEKFENIFNGIEEFHGRGNTEVVIYIHGGLNRKRDGLARARDNYQKILDSGKYPIFVNWRSGPITTYMDHLTRIRHGKNGRPLAWLTSPIYALTDVGNSIVNAPKSWIVGGEHAFNTTIHRSETLRPESFCEKKGPNVNFTYTEDNDNHSSFPRHAQWTFTFPFKIATTPFTYTLPKPAWDIMLRRTNTVFRKTCEFEPEKCSDDKSSEANAGYQAQGALSIFLRKLKAEKLPIKITLIGHSMGAIIVNKMVHLHPELPYKNIVHMASADSSRNLMNLVIPYLQRKKDEEVRFYSLSLHPENEDRELSAWGLTPSGSLLVWIDHMFTTPETVMDRRSGRWENMKSVIYMIPEDVRKKMHFKVFGIGNNCEPQKHGEFDEYNFWDESYWWEETNKSSLCKRSKSQSIRLME